MKFILLSLLLLGACITRRQAAVVRANDRRAVQEELGSEMSLKADREELSDLRKDVPEPVQKKNDELALFLNMMGQGTENPQAVRDKFNMMVQKRRAAFRDKTTVLREAYRVEETKRRERQMESAKSRRDSFVRRKHDAQATREFFAQQEKERLAFGAEERERRSAFEAELNAQSKDFDAYMRERQKEFDEQYRLYSKKFSEKPKEKKAATGDEFKRLENTPASPLGTEN